MKEWMKTTWCSWTHGGGRIKRDTNDRINWQCSKCGRWAVAVAQETENEILDRAITRAAEIGRSMT